MDKARAVAALEKIAQLMEYHGENAFKVRAFLNAAHALEAEAATLDDLASEKGRLEGIKGIGASTAAVIRELANTGGAQLLEELRAAAPPGMDALMAVPHLGPKKIRALHETLGVGTVADLEKALAGGKVEGLPGFGAKTVEKIAAGIATARRNAGRVLYAHAEAAVLPLLEGLRAIPGVLRAETAGSLRRRRETIGDVDLVAASDDPPAVIRRFVALPGIARVEMSGPTRATVILEEGLQADLRVVADSEFAAALQYFTGSKEHNTQLRARARRMGLRVNEYGVFRVEGGSDGPEDDAAPSDRPDARRGTLVATATEADIYGLLGLDFIEPEMREGNGEIDTAAARALPTLVRNGDYRGVLHVHSTWSDGKASIREMALAARDVHQWEYLGICDHSEAAAYASGIRRVDIAAQHAEIDALNAELGGGGFRILRGTECDILADGSLDYPPALLATMDFVVASIHSRFGMAEDEMTRRLLRALDDPHTTILGHMSGRLLLSRDPYRFDAEAVLRRAAETRTIIEINGDPNRLDLDWRLCRQAAEMGVRFAVNPDAHSVAGLRNVAYGINTARKGWLPAELIVNTLPVDGFLRLAAEIRDHKRGMGL